MGYFLWEFKFLYFENLLLYKGTSLTESAACLLTEQEHRVQALLNSNI